MYLRERLFVFSLAFFLPVIGSTAVQGLNGDNRLHDFAVTSSRVGRDNSLTAQYRVRGGPDQESGHPNTIGPGRSRDFPSGRISAGHDQGWRTPATAQRAGSKAEEIWRSKEMNILAVGMGVGDVTGDGKNEIVLIDPGTVYLYRISDRKMVLITQYSHGNLELKSVDVAKIRKRGPARIYVTAQNRGAIASFVLEYRDGKLVPAVQDFPYYLRVIIYPTKGPMLLGQKRGIYRMYEGPIFRLEDKGDELEVAGRFGVPMKIPIFGFAIGDFEGKRQPVIAVYDRDEHIRLYTPAGKRLFLSKEYYGGSDVLLRRTGPETRSDRVSVMMENSEKVYFRPRIMALDLDRDQIYEILAIAHQSKTMRLLSRTKMLEEGQVIALVWNGDSLEERWGTPKVPGMITDFTVDYLPGLAGKRLITVERKKTDWLSFLRSRSQVRAYDLRMLMRGGGQGRKDD